MPPQECLGELESRLATKQQQIEEAEQRQVNTAAQLESESAARQELLVCVLGQLCLLVDVGLTVGPGEFVVGLETTCSPVTDKSTFHLAPALRTVHG